MALKLRFNKKNLVPNIEEYIEVLLSTMLVVYVFKGLVFKIFPALGTFAAPWDLIIIVFLIFYFKNLFDLKIWGNDYF